MSAQDNGRRVVLSADVQDDGFALWITSDDGSPRAVMLNATMPEDPGPPLPVGVSHLLVADDALIPGRWGAHITLCGLQVRRPNATAAGDDDYSYYPDLRYCPECVGEAARWSAEPA